MIAQDMDVKALSAAAARDVVVLHRVFEAWLSGHAPNCPESFKPIEEALGPGFSMVIPDGTLVPRDAVIARLAASHGVRGSDFRILVEEVTPVATTETLAAVRYIERQSGSVKSDARRSLALLVPAPTETGVAWRFVQETWCA
ncbi:hypothetical protein [Salinarimonas ramus]|uniref:DUF4440 domain-containing protein n=1 Tax=Salinarimonas ramus TaxID=690164 RepID=A0A917V8D4_9HYPH|nr:hypothetical protein [Salinarimonas ramus]GGK48675.1 hypothetical protein GCM10011322_39620 [Salinarimonas ramus]